MKKYYQTVLLLFIAFINIGYAEVLHLSPEQLSQAQAQGVTVIDIRTPGEWKETGTIPNAKRIMFFDEQRKPLINEFMSQFQKIINKKEQPFILVCRSGSRTGKVTEFLDKRVGYTHGAHLRNGMKSWLKEKRAVEK